MTDSILCRPASLLCALVLVFVAAQLRAETTIYVGKHFEVRDYDSPVKYVFNGNTRVARVTGSLSANQRIQRLRLRAGWNLVSLAVTAPDFPDQLREFTSGPTPAIRALYRWQPVTRDYATISSGESVAAGTVLWVSAQTDATVAIRGGYVEATEWRAAANGTFVAVPALEAQPLTLPLEVTIWRYDARNRRWQAGLTGDLASLSDLPSTFAPGEAIYVHAHEPIDLGAPAREERIRYYHQDHLGSSSAMSDADGALVEETAFYPFGIPRHEHRLRQIEEHYQFTQKERDRESGLHYFEARYLAGGMSRFISVDPLYANTDASAGDPQAQNLYAYARNNPLQYIDPTGLEPDLAEIANAAAVHDTRAAQAAAQKEALNITLSASTGGVLNRGFLTFAAGMSDGMPTSSGTRLGFRAWEAMGMVDRDSSLHTVGFVTGFGLSLAIPSPIKGGGAGGRTATAVADEGTTLAGGWGAPVAGRSAPKSAASSGGTGGGTTMATGGSVKTWPGAAPPPPPSPAQVAARKVAARKEEWASVTQATPKDAWTHGMINQTRDARYWLPTTKERQDALRTIYEFAETLFKP